MKKINSGMTCAVIVVMFCALMSMAAILAKRK